MLGAGVDDRSGNGRVVPPRRTSTFAPALRTTESRRSSGALGTETATLRREHDDVNATTRCYHAARRRPRGERMRDLFGSGDEETTDATVGSPLAERMRPRRLDDVVGQDQALGPGTMLRAALDAGRLPSLVLWGPPGCGKTTLAACLAREVGATFLAHSAVRVGVKELKAVMAEAGKLRRTGARAPVLFLDEIHRFNRAQQDALLPAVEHGDVVLIGATTENPSFEVNAALLSRCRVVVLDALDEEALVTVQRRALERDDALAGIEAEDEALRRIARASGGDARFALGSLELAARDAATAGGAVDVERADRVLREAHLVHDKSGEEHFNLISALHKSLRNSDAQAGLYWLARMLEAGEHPNYVARRLVRFASEDVGLADPQALVQANAAASAVDRIGMPEGKLALAQACVYLAQAPKSNALYRGYGAAQRAVTEHPGLPVPLHLRNAPTDLMRDIGYGKGYRYAHDDTTGVAPMPCLPDEIRDDVYYRPTERGFEAEVAGRLRTAWKLARRPATDPPSGPESSPNTPGSSPEDDA